MVHVVDRWIEAVYSFMDTLPTWVLYALIFLCFAGAGYFGLWTVRLMAGG